MLSPGWAMSGQREMGFRNMQGKVAYPLYFIQQEVYDILNIVPHLGERPKDVGQLP